MSKSIPFPIVTAPDQIAWQRACAMAAEELGSLNSYDVPRLAKALVLTQGQAVQLVSQEDTNNEDAIYAVVQSGKTLYEIHSESNCTCHDHAKAGNICKHMMALDIYEHAIENFPEVRERLLEEPGIIVMPPAVPLASVHQHVENPAGANFKAKVGNIELWYTWHGSSDEEIMGRMRAILPELQAMVEACDARLQERIAQEREAAAIAAREQEVQKARTDLPLLLAQAVADAMKAQQNHGRVAATDTTPALTPGKRQINYCSLHHMEMTEKTNAQGSWWSHPLDEVGANGKTMYCRGK